MWLWLMSDWMFVLPTDELLAAPAKTEAAFIVLGIVMVTALVIAVLLYLRRKGNRRAPEFASLQLFIYLNLIDGAAAGPSAAAAAPPAGCPRRCS